jgi:hypothetical protein
MSGMSGYRKVGSGRAFRLTSLTELSPPPLHVTQALSSRKSVLCLDSRGRYTVRKIRWTPLAADRFMSASEDEQATKRKRRDQPERPTLYHEHGLRARKLSRNALAL